jgi:ATP-dependent DNA ligase
MATTVIAGLRARLRTPKRRSRQSWSNQVVIVTASSALCSIIDDESVFWVGLRARWLHSIWNDAIGAVYGELHQTDASSACGEAAPGTRSTYELKLDGYRVLAIKTGGQVRLRSRNDKDFNQKYPSIAKALGALPNEAVVDGEAVALDEAGRPSLIALQNGSAGATIVYYVFDVMILAGRNVMGETLARRRDLLTWEVLPRLPEPVREAPRFDAALADLIAAVRAKGLEGLVAKRLDSVYEPGARSGAWRKMRLNRSEEFVIGGYTKGRRTFDVLVLGRWDENRLIYVARTRVGFTPASWERLMAKLRPLEILECPFANLPEARSGRWGEGLTAEKMKECV